MKKNLNKTNNIKNFGERIKCTYETKCTAIIGAVLIALSFLFDKVVIQLANIIQYPLLFKIFYTITLLGESYVLIWVVLFISIILIANKHSIKKFIITLLVSVASGFILKTLINRSRPFETLQTTSTIATSTSSFPSGHAMVFFAMVPYLSQKFPKIKALFWILAILVAFSRIYLGVHYFSDVIAGAVFGYLIGMLILQVGEKHVKKN